MIALAEAFSGHARLQGMRRVAGLIRGVDERRYRALAALCARFSKESIERFTENPSARNDLNTLLPLSRPELWSSATDAVMEVARCYRALPTARKRVDELDALVPALAAWATRFSGIDWWIKDVRRLILVHDRWDGHQEGSGVRVSDSRSYKPRIGNLVLYLHPQDDPPSEECLQMLGTTVMTVGVTDFSAEPDTAQAHGAAGRPVTRADAEACPDNRRLLVLEADSSAGGEPFIVSWGYVLREPHTNAVMAQDHGQVNDENATHNDGEWHGVIEGMKAALKEGAGRLVILSDSELVVKQFEGRCAVRNARLKRHHSNAMALRRQFRGDVVAVWRSRDENQEADSLARAARMSPNEVQKPGRRDAK